MNDYHQIKLNRMPRSLISSFPHFRKFPIFGHDNIQVNLCPPIDIWGDGSPTAFSRQPAAGSSVSVTVNSDGEDLGGKQHHSPTFKAT